jgi:hypothetical protein
LSGFNETLIFSTHLKKYLNVKFHENPSRESRVVPCRRTEGWTDRRDEATVSFSQSAKAPENEEEKKLIKRMKLK